MYNRIETTKSIEVVIGGEEGYTYIDYPIATYKDEKGNLLHVTYWYPNFTICENNKLIELTDEILELLPPLLNEVSEVEKEDVRSPRRMYWTEHYKVGNDIIKLRWPS